MGEFDQRKGLLGEIGRPRRGCRREDRILFVQYTNPAAYPPLEHSSRILAEKNWKVTFLGTGSMGQSNEFCFPAHPNIEVRKLVFRPPGLGQKLQFAFFSLWVSWQARRRRVHWIYASDALSTPAALLAIWLSGCRVIYHEHDAPAGTGNGGTSRPRGIARFILRTRAALARRAAACVFPNAERAAVFRRETGTGRPLHCVWNCPERRELAAFPKAAEGTVLFYHGSLNRFRLPFAVLEVMARLPVSVSLRFAGYVTTGHQTFLDEFLGEARRLGLGDRVTYLGAPARRETLLGFCREANVGLAFMPAASDDLNMRTMSGASNKPFDYLACGLALVVSDLPGWRELFVENGLARSCRPEESDSLLEVLRWFVENPAEVRLMGERGRQKVLSTWNYETQFAPVVQLLEQES